MRAIGLRTHIWNNAWKSVLLLAGFPVLLTILAFGIALVLADPAGGFEAGLEDGVRKLPWTFAACVLVALVWFGIAWLTYQPILDLATGARVVTRQQEPRLWNLLEELCISRGMTMPRLAVIETPARNAFASGLSRETGAVTVTRGLMDGLTDRELRAVLAHELTHIRNGDARLGVIAAIFAGVLSLLGEVIVRVLRLFRGTPRMGRRSSRSRRSSSSSSSSGGGGIRLVLVLIGVALILLAWAMAPVLRMALSRNREYLADAGAVELTADADAMILALRKIADHSAMPGVPSQVRAMFLDDPPGRRLGWLLGTHPKIEDRVEALVRYAGGRDPGPIPAAPPPSADGATENASAEPGAAAPAEGNPWWRGPRREEGGGEPRIPWSP